ncbi:MAG: SRPBCC family protein [Deltaproteobacteria bacterium]|nr:SRPBCC family protein [Deltaproteobacteria bacterium]
MRGFLLVLGLLASSMAPLVVRAEGRPRLVQSRAALLRPETLAPLLARGELALIESNDDGSARQVVVLSAIGAPPEQVFDVITDVERYPEFMPSVVSIQIVKRQGDMVAYDWELDVPVFNLKGVRAMRTRRPSLIEVRGVAGNFKESRERFELYPLDGGKRTLVAVYRSIDVESAGLIMKTMIRMEPSMEQGVNLATGFVQVRDLRRRVEGLPLPGPRKPQTGAVPPFDRIAIGDGGLKLDRIEPLLALGPLALIESNRDGSLRQVVLLAEVEASREKLAQVIQAAERYPEFLPNFAKQTVTPAGDHQLKLEYELDVPLANLEGTSLMAIEPNGDVDVVAVDGDVKRGRWRWELVPFGAKTLPVHYAYSDIGETSFFVRQLIARQPLFEHGIVVAASTVAIIGMKARAEGRR